MRAIVCTVALATVAATVSAQRRPTANDKPAPPTSGAVVQYEESTGGRILYLEESGGLVNPLATPVPQARGALPRASPSAGKVAMTEPGPPKAVVASTTQARK